MAVIMFEDAETCSRCLVEGEWDDLTHVDETGENICKECLNEEIHGDGVTTTPYQGFLSYY